MYVALKIMLAFALAAGLATTPLVAHNLAYAKAFRETQTDQAQQQQQGANTITIPQGAGDRSVPSGNYYEPVTASVPSGAEVTWVNQDGLPHTSTAGDPSSGPSGQFDTGFIPAGQSASVTVTSEGTIPYYCTIHPWMVATLNVGGEGQQAAGQQQAAANATQHPAGAQAHPSNETQAAGQQGSLNQALQSLLEAARSLQQAIDAIEQAAGGGGQQAAPANATQAGNATTTLQVPAANATQQAGGQQQNQTQQAANATQTANATSSGQQGIAETSVDHFAEYLRENDAPVPEVTTSFPGMEPKINQTLPSVNRTETGFEQEHENNWITANHDIYGTRWSNQTIINKDNVNQLEVKWIYNHNQNIEDPPIVINDTAFFQDNNGLIIALDANTGLMKWKVDTGDGGLMHGLTYDNGVIFAGTGANGTVIAVNPENGEIFWESPVLGPTEVGFNIPTVPLVWQDVVIAGSAGGDLPTNPGVVQGNVTGLDRKTGEILWSLKLTAGEWVTPDKIPPNGGGTTWSSFSFDPETGILYAPVGNATPDFNAITRIDSPNWYTNTVMAINITNGQMVWATPFVAAGTVIDVAVPDTKDWDVSFGTSFSKVTMENGTVKKIVIGHDKMGNIIAMDAETGDEVWWKTLGTIYRPNAIPRPPPEGSGLVFPGAGHGIENWHAVDSDTVYVSTTSMGFNFFTQGLSGYAEPVINSTESGYGNGTVWALDLLTGDVKWQYDVDFPTKTSALVTNDVVFAGHMTPIGTPYEAETFGNPSSSPLFSSGIIVALDKQTGDKLWEFNVGEPIGIGGPSIGNGMLFVPTGTIHVPSDTGSIVAFGLPEGGNSTTGVQANITRITAVASYDMGESDLGAVQNSTVIGNTTMSAASPETTVANSTDEAPTLSTSGIATTQVEPDKISITVGVETNGTTAQEAAAANANRTAQVIAALDELGVGEQQISTSSYNVYPIHEQNAQCPEIFPPPPGCEPGQISGYGASNAISVTLDVGQGVNASEVIDAAIQAGANNVNSLSFFVSQEKQQMVRNDLIQGAIENARERADIASETLGMQVSGVKTIELNDASFPVFSGSFAESRTSTQTAATPVLPGEQEVRMNVNIVFYIS